MIQSRTLVCLSALLILGGLMAEELPPFDLSTSELGGEPEGGFVLDGNLKVIEIADSEGRGIEIAAEPLVESGMLLGDTARGRTEIQATVLAEKRGRSHPRFGIGSHGISGFRLRVVPASKKVELVYKEKSVAELPFVWESGVPHTLRLVVAPPVLEGEAWTIEGYVWKGETVPEKPTVVATEKDLRGQGKASLWGTPYAGSPIQFSGIALKVDTGK